jgi:hypothetical protein
MGFQSNNFTGGAFTFRHERLNPTELHPSKHLARMMCYEILMLFWGKVKLGLRPGKRQMVVNSQSPRIGTMTYSILRSIERYRQPAIPLVRFIGVALGGAALP